MNSRKAKQLRQIAKICQPNNPRMYRQLKGLWKRLSHKQRAHAKRSMAVAHQTKTTACVFCTRLFITVIDKGSKSKRIKARPLYRTISKKHYSREVK